VEAPGQLPSLLPSFISGPGYTTGGFGMRCGQQTLIGIRSGSACFMIPAKARDYVFTGVGLSVCLSVCLFVTTITK